MLHLKRLGIDDCIAIKLGFGAPTQHAAELDGSTVINAETHQMQH